MTSNSGNHAPESTPQDDVQAEIQKLLDDKPAVNNIQRKHDEAPAPAIPEVAFWIMSSVASSVGIIIILKIIMYTYGFGFVLTLTFCHFFCQMITLETAAFLGLFQAKRIPFQENFIVASSMVASVMFMNYSLRSNSVGFYQVTKLACVPCMVIIESAYFGKVFSRKIKTTLAVIILGVGLAVVTDVEFNFKGLVYGCLAIFFTTQFQIWTSSKQKEHGLQGLQFQHSQSHAVTIIVFILLVVFEIILPEKGDSLLEHEFSAGEVFLIFLSCLLAIAVNVTSASLIGKTSAVTYQVVGHMKTCLVLMGGFMLFPISATPAQWIKNLSGILVAVVGGVVYGNLKLAEQQKRTDVCDRFCSCV